MRHLRRLIGYAAIALTVLNTPAAFGQTQEPTMPLEQAFVYKAHKAAGDSYLSRGKYAQAISEYEKALALNPESTAAYFNLAIAHYSAGHIQKAAHALEKLLRLNPSDVEAQYNLACLSLYLKDVDKAKLHFQQAIAYRKLNPQFTPLIKQAFQFLQELHKSDTNTQDIIFLLLKQGLPAISLTA